MKRILILLIPVVCLFSCNNTKEKTEEGEMAVQTPTQEVNYQSFGEKFTAQDVLTKDEMIAKYQTLKEGDTITMKFTSTVKSVCQSKGCWMRLDMGEAESFVKFKDYAFFMPKDIAGQEVIVAGKAFVEETSVDDLKHFAEDAGKSKEEIDAITAPEKSFSFLSSGVLIPETN